MSILSQITKGKIKRPHFALIYGGDFVGKSTFGSQFPKPVFIGSEKGTSNLDVHRISIASLPEFLSGLQELLTEKHEFESVIVDSVDWLEPLVWDHVCKENSVTSIEKVGGGYGKGYTEALNLWRRVLRDLEALRDRRGMNILLIAHAHVKTMNDPSLPAPYDRHQLKLNDKAAALLREAVDCVLFAKFETFVKKEGTKGKAFGDGKRIMYTEWRAAFDAKNRFGLPFEMPLDFKEFDAAIRGADQTDVSAIKKDIEDLISQVQDENLKKVMQDSFASAQDDKQKLTLVLNRIRARLS